jgi:hypothetical protein
MGRRGTLRLMEWHGSEYVEIDWVPSFLGEKDFRYGVFVWLAGQALGWSITILEIVESIHLV